MKWFDRQVLIVLAAGVCCAVASSGGVGKGALLSLSLPGVTSHDGWTAAGMNSVNNPGYPTAANFTDPWPAPIGSTVGGDGLFNKTSGGGYPISPGAGGGVYTFFAAGSFDVYDVTPVANLQTVVLQVHVESEEGDSGTAPVLNYNSGSQALAATLSVPLAPFEFLYQWDLSAIAGPITSFDIDHGYGEHHQVFEMQLDQGDVMSVVPEPSTLLLAGLGFAGISLWARKRNGG